MKIYSNSDFKLLSCINIAHERLLSFCPRVSLSRSKLFVPETPDQIVVPTMPRLASFHFTL